METYENGSYSGKVEEADEEKVKEEEEKADKEEEEEAF